MRRNVGVACRLFRVSRGMVAWSGDSPSCKSWWGQRRTLKRAEVRTHHCINSELIAGRPAIYLFIFFFECKCWAVFETGESAFSFVSFLSFLSYICPTQSDWNEKKLHLAVRKLRLSVVNEQLAVANEEEKKKNIENVGGEIRQMAEVLPTWETSNVK